MTPEQLKASILQYAIQGKLVEQRSEEGTAEELYRQIQEEKQRLVKERKIKKEKPLPEIAEDEVPFEIPESWKWCRVGTIISISSGDGLTSKEMDESGIYPVYGGNGVNGYYNAYNITKKTLVIGRVGFYCGSTHITEGNAWVTDNAFITTFDEDKIDMKWLKCYIDYLNPRKKASSTAQPVISRKLIYPMLVSLPPLAEQKRIVAKLEELLPLVERYAASYEKLEQFNAKFPENLKKSILQYAIQGRLVEQRPEEGTAEELYRQIQEEKQRLVKEGKIKKEKPLPEITEDEVPFEIPESWKWVHFAEVIDVRDGTHDTPMYVTTGVPLVTSKNLVDGNIDFETTKLISVEDAKEINMRSAVDEGDILFAMIGTIGNPVLVRKDREFSIKNIALFKAIGQDLLDMKYLLLFLQNEQYIMKKKASGGVQSFVSLKLLRNYALPLPPIAEQKRIVTKIEELLPLCEQLK